MGRPGRSLPFRITTALALLGAAIGWGAPAGDPHARPRALAFDAAQGLLYVALSTADQVAVVAPGAPPRLVAKVAACGFPEALATLPAGGVVVACRHDRGLLRITRDGRGTFATQALAPDLLAGTRGLAVSADGSLLYATSPPLGGVAVVSLRTGTVVQTIATGISPRAVRLIPSGFWPGVSSPLLIVSNFIEHTVTLHPIDGAGRVGAPLQAIRTAAPVLDLVATGGDDAALWLLTHEDRPVSRAHGPVEGLDSGVVRLPVRSSAGSLIADPGPGRRPFVNLGDRPEPVIELAAAAGGRTVAIAGAGSDNLLLLRPDGSPVATVPVGANPSAVAALPDGRFVTADRLSDTLTFVDPLAADRGGAGKGPGATLVIGKPARTSPAEAGELLFYSRALVPNNSAAGPLSLYTCAACHDDGDRDGRLHPAKQNRFLSTTLTCRGLATTAPFLRLGNQATLAVFADNIVSTHAQGAERDPAHFADYPVALRMRDASGWRTRTLSPAEIRAALAAYMAQIPTEPSPFVAPGARALTAQASRGLALFRDGCAGCHRLVGDAARGEHVPDALLEARLLAGRVALTAPGRYDVGTPVLGEGGNNPPSLRGVWDAAPYFSDGSARTLEEVLRRTDPDAGAVHAAANAARPPAFSADEQAALLAFLRSL
ncbi:MAG TPA: c-type cytochrome [Polyangia bacterium]|nr:c-type cytochrome [Polyangia bacterium]